MDVFRVYKGEVEHFWEVYDIEEYADGDYYFATVSNQIVVYDKAYEDWRIFNSDEVDISSLIPTPPFTYGKNSRKEYFDQDGQPARRVMQFDR